MFDLTTQEEKILKKLDTPGKIQDFLNKLEINFEENGETCMSPRRVLETRKCHCIEGAMLAALALRLHGQKPLIVDLTASKEDFDHVIAVFRENGKWGAISKTNHAVLRYREPVYSSIQELVMSFFHEYFEDDGIKTLRSYSEAVDLSRFDELRWMTSEDDVWFVDKYLGKARHFRILNQNQISKLRKADKIEIEAGKIVEYRKKDII